MVARRRPGAGQASIELLAALPALALAAALALQLLLVGYSVAVSGVLLARGVGAPDVPVAQDYDVTVLSWNTLGDSVPAAAIAQAAAQNGADVIALPETTRARARQVAALLAAQGSRFRVFSASQQTGIPSRSTSLLVARSLGA